MATDGAPRSPAPGIWNLANGLTALRVALVPVFGWLLLRDGGQEVGSRIAAFVVFTLAIVTDHIDGQVARRRNMVTDLGAVVDPIADKALTGAAFVGLSLLGELTWWVTAVVVFREVGVTGLRLWVIRHGVIPASRGGKLKTILQGLALGGLILPLTGWLHGAAVGVMAAAVVVTVVTGVDYVVRALRLRRVSRERQPTPP